MVVDYAFAIVFIYIPKALVFFFFFFFFYFRNMQKLEQWSKIM